MPEQNILSFVYNKTGADSSEWFEPSEDATTTRHRNQNQQQAPRSMQPHRPAKTNKQGPSKQAQQKPEPKSVVSSGAVYIMHMRQCGNSAPLFAKVGSSTRTENNCEDRKGELQTGNPHELVCHYTFDVVGNLLTTERKVHDALKGDGLNTRQSLGCDGGTEWYSFPGNGVQSLAVRVEEILENEELLA